MKIFLICPVRRADEVMREFIDLHVEGLEAQGHQVHYPARDTDQEKTGTEICHQNLEAIRSADAVYIIWDPESGGTKFDLGIAFALGKPIKVLTDVERTDTKSFEQLLVDWEKSHDPSRS